MSEWREELLQWLGDSTQPELSSETLHIIENFLTFGLDSDIQSFLPVILNSLIGKIGELCNTQTMLIGDFESELDAYVHVLRYVKPSHLSAEQAAMITNAGFRVLNSQTGAARRSAFALLVDHFNACRLCDPVRVQELVEWMFSFVRHATDTVPNFDHRLMLVIIGSIRMVYRCIGSNTNLLAPSLDLFLKLVLKCMERRNEPDFIPKLESIVAKTLRLIAHFLGPRVPVSPTLVELSLRLWRVMQDCQDTKFLHITLNYWFFVCALIERGQQRELASMTEEFLQSLMRNMFLFMHPPFSQDRRTAVFFQTLARWIAEQKKANLSEREQRFLLQSSWIHLSNVCSQPISVRSVAEILRLFMNDDFFAKHPGSQLDFLCQLVASLELIKEGVEAMQAANSHNFDMSVWCESNLHVMRLIRHTAIPENSQAVIHSEQILTHFLGLFGRVLKYTDYLLDLIGAIMKYTPEEDPRVEFFLRKANKRDFRERMKMFIQPFLEDLAISLRIFSGETAIPLFTKYMKYLIPRQEHHGYHHVFHQIVIRTKPAYVPIYHLVFFEYITDNFEELFEPKPSAFLFKLVTAVFHDVFVVNGQVEPVLKMANLLHKFMILLLSSRQTLLIGLVGEIAYIMQKKENAKSARLSETLKILKANSLLIYLALKYLAEDSSIDVKIAIVAMMLYPTADFSKPEPTNSWPALFLPALETKVDLTNSVVRLFQVVPRYFSKWVRQMREPAQSRFISALATAIPNIAPKVVSYVKSLLCQVPDLAVKYSRIFQETRHKHRLVTFNGQSFSLNVLFDAIQREPKHTESELEFFETILCSFIESTPMAECLTVPILRQIMEFLVKEKRPIVDNMYESMQGVPMYTALVLRQKYGTPIKEILDSMESIEDFVSLLTTCCIQRENARVFAEIVAFCLPRIPTGMLLSKVNVNLVHLLLYEPERIGGIIEKYICAREYHTYEEKQIRRELVHQYATAATFQLKAARRVVIQSVVALTDGSRNDISDPSEQVTPLDDRRKAVLRDITAFLRSNNMYGPAKLDFIFAKPFGDAMDPASQIENLLGYLTTNVQIPNISPEIRRVYKPVVQDQHQGSQLLTIKFIFRAIAHLFPYVLALRQQPLWERLVQLLRSEMWCVYTKYFLSQLRKASCSGLLALPTDLGPQFQNFTGQQLAILPEDMLLVSFLVRNSPQADHSIHLRWLSMALRLVHQSFKPTMETGKVNFYRIMTSFIDMFVMFNEIQEPRMDISILSQFLDLLLTIHMSTRAWNLPVHLLVEAYPRLTVHWIISKNEASIRLEVISFVARLLSDPQCREFRQLAMTMLVQDYGKIYAFIEHKTDILLSLIMQCCGVAGQMYDSLNEGDFDLQLYLRAIRCIFITYVKTRKTPMIDRPALLQAVVEGLLPVKFSSVLNTDPNSMNCFRNDIVPLFLQAAGLLCNSVFIVRFTQLMTCLTPAVREEIYNDILRFNSTNMTSRLLVNLLMLERYRTFPLESPTERELVVSEKPAMLTPFLLENSQVLWSSTPNVRVTNLSVLTHLMTTYQIHAIALRDGLVSCESIVSLSRLFNISSVFSDMNCDPPAALGDLLLSLLRDQPFCSKQSLLAFSKVARNQVDIDRYPDVFARLCLAITSVSLASHERMANAQRFLMTVGPAFMTLKKDTLDSAGPAILEALLSTCVYIFEKGDPRAHGVAEATAAYFPLFENRIRGDILGALASILVSVPATEERVNPAKIRFLFDLLPPMARYVFTATTYPFDMLPVRVFATGYTPETMELYEKVLSSAFISGGCPVGRVILKNVLANPNMKGAKLSAALPSPFATVCQWLHEIADDANLVMVIKMLMNVFKPKTLDALAFDISHLKQPIHMTAVRFIKQMFTDDFPEARSYYQRIPQTWALLGGSSHNVEKSVWNVDWFAISERLHVTVFLKMMMPESIVGLVDEFTESEAMGMAVPLIQTLPHSDGFVRFTKYYVSVFPSTKLTEVFSMTATLGVKYPFLDRTPFGNMQELDRMNMSEDSLGILKTEYPNLNVAASFHQLCQYKAAKAMYLRQMSEDENCYFAALVKLRACSINITVPLTPELYDKLLRTDASSGTRAVLPFFQDYALRDEEMGSLFTTFFCPIYIPYLMNSILFDEVHQMLKIMQQRAPEMVMAQLESLIMSTSSVWLHDLDKQMIMASNFAWRNTIWNRMSEINDPKVIKYKPQIRDSLMINQRSLVSMLARAGAVKTALSLSLVVATNYREPRPMSVNPAVLPRILRFLNGLSMQPGSIQICRDLRFKTAMSLRNFSMLMGETQGNIASQVWFRVLIAVLNCAPQVVEPVPLFTRLLSELNSGDQKMHNDGALLMSLAMWLIERNPPEQLYKVLASFVGQMKDEQRRYWLKWLPQLFYRWSKPPVELLATLIRVIPWTTVLTLRHIENVVQSTETKQVIRDFEALCREKQQERPFNEYNKIFAFLEDTEAFERLAKSISAHRLLCQVLSLPGGRELPPALVERFSDVDGLAKFCEENRPVFKPTRPYISEFNQLSGFKIPGAYNIAQILRVMIEADGTKEALLRVVTMRGESRTYGLVSPFVYRTSDREYLFTSCIARYIHNHQSSCSRSSFLSYPATYLIHKGLALLDCRPFASMSEIAHPWRISALLAQARANVVEPTHSPLSYKERQTIDVPSDLLFKWFVKGSEGNKLNFVFMRQNFASMFSCFSFLHAWFSPRVFCIPSIMFFEDRQKVCMAGFADFSAPQTSFHIALTKNIETLLPKFVLRGSFSTSWMTFATALSKHAEKVRFYMNGLVSRAVRQSLVKMDQSQPMRDPVEVCIRRLALMALPMGEDTDKSDDIFPFSVLEHLIENSQNAVKSQFSHFGWI